MTFLEKQIASPTVFRGDGRATSTLQPCAGMAAATALLPAPSSRPQPRHEPNPARHLPPRPPPLLTLCVAPSWRQLLGGAAEPDTALPPGPAAQHHCGRPAGEQAGGKEGEGGAPRAEPRCTAPARPRGGGVPRG